MPDIEAIRSIILKHDAAIVFDEATHTYRWDDCIWPSVSQLNRPVTEKELAAIPRERLEAARQRGTAVHDAIKNYLDSGCMFDLSEGETALLMAQFKRFLTEHQVIIVAYEVKLRAIAWGFAGRADLVYFRDGQPILRVGDVKATYDVMPSVALQISSYTACLNSYELPCQIGEPDVIHLGADKYELIPEYRIPAPHGRLVDREEVEKTARALITLNSWITKYGR